MVGFVKKTATKDWRHALVLSFVAASVISSLNVTARAAELELSVWSAMPSKPATELIEKQMRECLKDSPGISLKYEAIDWATMYKRLLVSTRSGDLPNILYSLDAGISFLQARGLVSPVDDVVDKHGRADFAVGLINAMNKDGKTWGVPDWALHYTVWYRKDLFKQAGLSEPKSWDELLAAAKKLTKKPEMYGMGIPLGKTHAAFVIYFQYLYSAGGYVFDPKTGEYAFDKKRKEAVDAMKMVLTMYKQVSPPSSIEWDLNDYRSAFVKGLVAMTDEWAAVVGMAKEQNPGLLDNIGAFAHPGPSAEKPAAASLNGGYYFSVTKSTSEKELASKNLLGCLYQPDLIGARANARPVFALPATLSGFDSSVFQENDMVKRFKPEIEMIRDKVLARPAYRYGMEAGLNPLAGVIESTSFVADAIQSAALGRTTAEQAVDEIDRQLRLQIARLAKE